MANDSIDHLNILSETDLFSTTMSQDESLTSEFLLIDQTKHFKNLPGAMPISFNQMFRTQNSNAPWLINVLKKKFSRSRYLSKRRENRNSSIQSMTDDEILDKPISTDGTSGKWMVNEKDLALPLIKVVREIIMSSCLLVNEGQLVTLMICSFISMSLALSSSSFDQLE